VPQASKDEKPPWPERPLAERRPAPVVKGKVELLPNSVWRDQDGTARVWYRLDPKGEWQMLTYRVSGDPVTVRRVALLPDGRLMISTTDYDGLYTYDLKTRKMEHEGVDAQSHYCTLVLGDKVYLGGYPGGNLYIWDPAKPWTTLKGTPERPVPYEALPESNPYRTLWAKPNGFQHPRLLLQGSDGFLYAGIHGERANVGGVISWCDLQGGNGGFLRDPFELYDVAGMCTALGGSKIIYSSFAVRGGKGEPRPAAGRLFVFDVATRTIDWFIDPLPGINSTGFVVEYAPGKLLLATAWQVDAEHKGTAIYKVDMETRKVTHRVDFPGQLNTGGYYWLTDFHLGPDGKVYTICDDSLVRIDPATLAITRLSQVGRSGSFVFVGNDVYLTGTSHLRRVAGVLP
jgi:hypothetical protein